MAGRKVRLLVKIERRIERARGEPRGSFEKKTDNGQRAAGAGAAAWWACAIFSTHASGKRFLCLLGGSVDAKVSVCGMTFGGCVFFAEWREGGDLWSRG